MSEIRKGLLYTDTHYWVELEDEGMARVGRTDFGQAELREVTGVHLPAKGESVEGDTAIGEFEASDTAEEILSPVSGQVVESNADLEESPALINEEPYGDGWLFVVQLSDLDEVDALMSASEYEEYLQSELGEEDYEA